LKPDAKKKQTKIFQKAKQRSRKHENKRTMKMNWQIKAVQSADVA